MRIAIVALAALAGFLLIINDSWNATPDSALYLALGESMAKGNGYVFNGEPHTFVPPGYPLLVAAAARLGGPSFLSYRLMMVVAGIVTAILGYALVARLVGPNAGFFAGALFLVNHTLLENCTVTLSDVPFSLFALLALNALVSATKAPTPYFWIAAAGIVIGLLPLFRVNGLGVAPPVALFLFLYFRNRRLGSRLFQAALLLALACIPAIMWAYVKSTFPQSTAEGSYLYQMTERGLLRNLGVMAEAAWGYFSEMSYALSGLSLKTGVLETLFPCVAAVGAATALRNGDRLLVPVIAVQFCGLLLSTAGSRYLIFMIPALYLFLGLGVIAVVRYCSARLPRCPSPRAVLSVLFVFIAVCNVGHNVKTVYAARTAVRESGAESERSVPFFRSAQWLKANAADSVVLTNRSRIIHYLSGCRVVPLLRSGVPEAEMWVDSPALIESLVERTRPDFLFADTKDHRLFPVVTDTLNAMGLILEEIPEASTPPRFLTYKIARAM
ncbi:MAG: glycosyltransferase family 39 protein, partial [Pseudomonadota bacterium]